MLLYDLCFSFGLQVLALFPALISLVVELKVVRQNKPLTPPPRQVALFRSWYIITAVEK